MLSWFSGCIKTNFQQPFLLVTKTSLPSGRGSEKTISARSLLELELELIQTQMAQKPMLRAEVYAHAMRASQNRKKEVRREKEV